MTMSEDYDSQLALLNRRLANIGEKLRCLAIREAADTQEQVLGSDVVRIEPFLLYQVTRAARTLLIKVVDKVHSYLYEQNGSEEPVMVS